MISGHITPLSGLGDRAYYSTSPTNKRTHIRFRRKNVVLSLGIDLPSDAAINIAKRMDNELEHNRTLVTRGDKITLPQIEIKNLPKTVGLNKTVECELELKDIDPNEVLIYSDSAAVVVVKKEKVTKIVYYSPKNEKEIGLKTFRIFVANQKNVLMHREYKIKVTAN